MNASWVDVFALASGGATGMSVVRRRTGVKRWWIQPILLFGGTFIMFYVLKRLGLPT